GTGAGAALDLAEEVGPDRVDPLLEALGVEEPERGGDRGEERVAVLRGEAEADHLVVAAGGQGRHRDDRLGEDAAEEAVVAAEAEDLVCRGLLGERDARVLLEPGDGLIAGA